MFALRVTLIIEEFLCKDLAHLAASFLPSFPFWSLVKVIKPLHQKGDVTYEDVPFLYLVSSFNGSTIFGYKLTQVWDTSPTIPYGTDADNVLEHPDAYVCHAGVGSPTIIVSIDEADAVIVPEEDRDFEISAQRPLFVADYHGCHWCGVEVPYHSSEKTCRCVGVSVAKKDVETEETQWLYVFFFLFIF